MKKLSEIKVKRKTVKNRPLNSESGRVFSTVSPDLKKRFIACAELDGRTFGRAVAYAMLQYCNKIEKSHK